LYTTNNICQIILHHMLGLVRYNNLMVFKKRAVQHTQGVVLLLQVPRTNEKKELAAEQMFASLHGLLHTANGRKAHREHLSLEIAVQQRRIGFYLWVPEHLKSFVEEQIYAQYPDVHISEVEDYTRANPSYPTQLAAQINFTAHEALPIKTFPSFEVDPLAAITATLAQFNDDEEAWIQILVRPAEETWYKKSEKYAMGIRGGKTSTVGTLSALWAPPETKTEAPKLMEHQSARASAAEEKSHKLAYEVVLRVAYRGQAPAAQARMRIQSIAATFKQFNTTYLNGFSHKVLGGDQRFIVPFQNRTFGKKGFVCNIEEVASLYHLPHTNVETPNILWSNAQTAEPPANLPVINETNRDTVSPVGVTNFRGHNTMFGIPRVDRGRHLYIIGQTGTGKSGLLELLTISDIYSPYGFAVVDPHGDYAINILKRIPEHRVKDVIYFNPADMDYPIAFNPMEVLDAKLKTHTTSEIIGVLKRMFESWGPRLEYILRYSLLALLDYPDSTMLDITRILTDKKFRTDVLKHVHDPVVRNFWDVEFASWNDKFAAEAVAPVLNKVGAFTANPIVRNIIGQPKSSFNIRQIMDERKILLVNLSRGLIGEDNAALLGALLVTKIQLGAMSRADIDASERVPYYLYVDEFQNFATDSFATILSEARKYGLNLTVANQYIAQMMQTVKDAVFGNVGSIISFRTSADDARTMMKYFEPKFTEYDLVHMHNRHIVLSMTIEGEKVQAYSALTLELPPQPPDHSAEIIEQSRRLYAVGRSDIEVVMHERYTTPVKQDAPKPQTEPTKKADAKKVVADVARVVKGVIEKPEAVVDGTDSEKPKRKRTRKRKRKPSEPSTVPAPKEPPKKQSQDLSEETVINLR
jgi:Type IV secretion-system coupling protein DNA-binding domain